MPPPLNWADLLGGYSPVTPAQSYPKGWKRWEKSAKSGQEGSDRRGGSQALLTCRRRCRERDPSDGGGRGDGRQEDCWGGEKRKWLNPGGSSQEFWAQGLALRVTGVP